MKIPSYSITKSAITVVFPGVGRPVTINSSYQTQFSQAINFIKDKDWAGLKRVSDLTLSLRQYMGRFVYKNGECFFDGKKLHNIVAAKIKEFYISGLPVDSLIKFLENSIQNPNQKAIEELYLFLEKNNFTLTEDGCFLGWRKVDSNFLSYHSNPDGTKNRNKPGDVVSMDRDRCNFNRAECNAGGLHVAAFEYLPHYFGGSGKVVIVKVNPRNCISVPEDHGNAKLRCCEYEVIEEVLDGETNNILSNKSYFSTSQGGIAYHNKRDKNGRFVKLQ